LADSRYTASGSFRLRPHRPVRTAIVWLLIATGLGVGSWQLYELGLRHGGYNSRMARATEAHLRVQVSDLRDEVSKLSNRNTLLERAERIDREAREKLRGVIENRDDRIGNLQEELAFYRNLVSPSDNKPGLHVRRFELTAVSGEPRVYDYELVLTQLNGNDKYTSGRVDLKLDGRNGRKRVRMGLDELTGDKSPQTRFKFKYLQTLTGRIHIPEGLQPARFELHVVPSGGRLDPLEKSYAWDSLLSGGN